MKLIDRQAQNENGDALALQPQIISSSLFDINSDSLIEEWGKSLLT